MTILKTQLGVAQIKSRHSVDFGNLNVLRHRLRCSHRFAFDLRRWLNFGDCLALDLCFRLNLDRCLALDLHFRLNLGRRFALDLCLWLNFSRRLAFRSPPQRASTSASSGLADSDFEGLSLINHSFHTEPIRGSEEAPDSHRPNQRTKISQYIRVRSPR